uniref:SGNH hydrolase-type esterase domain-containing protein n=1 Tax=Pygocentrus nattereri TaxID=42514 RepID=A0A3B4DPH6_PYGNA
MKMPQLPFAGCFVCSECGMFSLTPFSASSDSDSVCTKCQLVSCLVEKVDQLEVRIRGLLRDRQPEAALAAPGTLGRVSTPSTPASEPSQRGEWVTTRRSSRKAKANANAEAKASPPEHHAPPIRVSNRFAPLSEAPTVKPVKSTLVIGDSIVRHVKLATPLGAPAVTVRCLSGARAPDISGNLRLADRRYSRIVIHVGANDIRLRQSEVTKANIREVVKQAQTMSDAVICSGPIPMRRGAEAYSRLTALNRWMSKWCSENQVGFIDNWLRFEGKPGLIGRDGVHPTREGAALLSCSIAHSLLVSRQSSVNRC